MEKNLIFIDLKNKKCLFYDISISKKDKEYLIIGVSGKIGNKGNSTLIDRKNDYQDAVKLLWIKIKEKKLEGYRIVEDVEENINVLFDIRTYHCDLCKKNIDESLYRKIDNFLRKETTVDNDKDNKAYKKVLCFECQKEHNIISYKK